MQPELQQHQASVAASIAAKVGIPAESNPAALPSDAADADAAELGGAAGATVEKKALPSKQLARAHTEVNLDTQVKDADADAAELGGAAGATSKASPTLTLIRMNVK